MEALFWLYSVVANVQLFRITSKKSLRAALFSDLPESSRAASSTSTAEAAQEYWPFPYQRATKYYPVYEWNWPFSPFFLLCLFGARAAAFRPRWGLKTSKSTKKDMTAVVIPRGNWMLLFFFFSATLGKSCISRLSRLFEKPEHRNSSIKWLWHEFNATFFARKISRYNFAKVFLVVLPSEKICIPKKIQSFLGKAHYLLTFCEDTEALESSPLRQKFGQKLTWLRVKKKSCWYKNLNAVPHLLERKMRRILPFYVELLLGARRNFMRARLLHLLLSAWIPIPFFCSIHQKCGRVERAERICFSFQFQRDSAARRDGGEISSLLLQLLNFSLGTTTTTYYSGGGRAGAKRIWKLWFSPLLTLLPENEFMAWLESTLIPNGISAIFFTCQLVGL